MLNDIIYLFKNSKLIILYIIALLTSTFYNNVYIVLLFSILTIIFIFPLTRWNIDKRAIYILVFSISYYAIIYINGINESFFLSLCYLFSPFAFYIFGRHITNIFGKKRTILLIILSILAFPIFAYFNILKDILSTGFVNSTRLIMTIGRENPLSATLYALIFSVNLGGAGIFIAYKDKKSSIFPYIFLSLCILSLIGNIHLVNRTGIVLFALATIIGIIYRYRKNIFGIIISIALTVLVLWLLYDYEIISSNIIDAYQQRTEYDELNDRGFTSERDIRWLMSIENLFVYPLGWSNINIPNNDFAHNLWLDVARFAGIIPFVALILATIMSLKDIIYICMRKFNNYNLILVILYTLFFASSFVEPIMQGLPLYFNLFTMLWGISRQSIINKYV